MAEALSSLLDTTGATSETSTAAPKQKAKRPKPSWVLHREEVTGETWDFNEGSGKWEKTTENVPSKNVAETFGIEKGTKTGGWAETPAAEPSKPKEQIASGKAEADTSDARADEVWKQYPDMIKQRGYTQESWRGYWKKQDKKTRMGLLEFFGMEGKPSG